MVRKLSQLQKGAHGKVERVYQFGKCTSRRAEGISQINTRSFSATGESWHWVISRE